MKATLADIMKALPDFEDMEKISDEIADLMFRKLVLDKEIKAGESDVFRRFMTDKSLYQGEKPYPVSYVENAYRYSGMDGELLPKRQEYAEVSSKLEKARLRLEIYKQMMDIWRTLSANERSSAL